MQNLSRKYKSYKRAHHLENLRRLCVPLAHGKVLEFCSGLGVNFEYYNPDTVTSVTVVEKNKERLDFSKCITPSTLKGKISFIEDEVTHFINEYKSNTFDTVVFPLCLCVFDNPKEVVEKSLKLLNPNGLVVSFQHGYSTYSPIAWFQKIADRLYRHTIGCHLVGDYNSLFEEIEGLVKIESYKKYAGIFHVSIYKKSDSRPAMPDLADSNKELHD